MLLTDLRNVADQMFLRNHPLMESEVYTRLVNQVLQLPEKHLLKDVQLLDQELFRF